MDDFDNLFDDDGVMPLPTMRGNANLDPQDYAHPDGGPTTFLDDEIQEDTPSTPGSGAGPATDVVGTSSLVIAPDDDSPGMEQTTYGQHPWGPGSGSGYRPYSMAQTDLDLSGVGGEESPGREYDRGDEEDRQRSRRLAEMDAEEVLKPRGQSQFNPQPSNAGIDPLTIYDRESYEQHGDPQAVIGNGVFDMEEGVTFRSRDGIFQNQYAEPAYVVHDGEVETQQSEMWDSTAQNWRVTQPSGGGVSFAKRVDGLKPRLNRPKVYSPFTSKPMPEMRPEITGPRSHVEAFGRKAAQIVLREASSMPTPAHKSAFLSSALESLGPKMAVRARTIADRLTQLGYPAEQALEDTVAHCVMHATLQDLTARARKGGGLPRLDKLGTQVRHGNKALRDAALQHLQPLSTDPKKLQSDLGSFYASPAAAGMGEVATTTPADASPGALVTTATSNTVRNVVIGGAVLGAGYYFFSQTKTGKKVQANAAKAWSKVTGSKRRGSKRRGSRRAR